MIYFVESNKENQDHQAINEAMIHILGKIFNDKIHVFSTQKHFDNLRLTHDVDLSRIKVIDRGAKSWIIKVLYEVFNLWKILKVAKSKEVRFVYISSVFPITHYFIKIIKKAFPSVKMIIGLHGEIEFVRARKSAKLKFLGKFIRLAFDVKLGSNTKYLVFGDIIKKNLLALNLLNSDELISIDHPYQYDVRLLKSPNEEVIRIGMIGLASTNKNSHFIYQLAELLENEIALNKLSVEIIGKILPNVLNYSNSLVLNHNSEQFLSRELFEKRIQFIQYAVFFYDNHFYKLCASGAFFDAVKFEKPILALKNDFFEYYFEKLGDIGFLFNDLNEMRNQIKSIVDGQCRERRLIQINNLKKAKQVLSLESIAIDFDNQLTENRFLL